MGCAVVAQHDMFARWTLAHACLVLCNTLDLAPDCFSSDLIELGIGLSNAGSVDRGLVPCEFVVERIEERLDQVIEQSKQHLGLVFGGADWLGVHARQFWTIEMGCVCNRLQ